MKILRFILKGCNISIKVVHCASFCVEIMFISRFLCQFLKLTILTKMLKISQISPNLTILAKRFNIFMKYVSSASNDKNFIVSKHFLITFQKLAVFLQKMLKTNNVKKTVKAYQTNSKNKKVTSGKGKRIV